MLAPPNTIVVIAPDLGLRQALTFALEVEGFKVEAHAGWCKPAAATISISCLIIDDQVYRGSSEARDYLIASDHSMILLTDGISAPRAGSPGLILAKPFEGAELLKMVRSFALAA